MIHPLQQLCLLFTVQYVFFTLQMIHLDATLDPLIETNENLDVWTMFQLFIICVLFEKMSPFLRT